MKTFSPRNFTIVILGSGNLATQLGLALHKKGFQVGQVYSPHKTHAKTLASRLKALPVHALNQINKTADLYLIALKDDAIGTVARSFNVKDKLVVHTSGSVSMDVLKKMSTKTGVLYPVQSINSKRRVDWTEVPFCIEANTASGKRLLEKLAHSLSPHILSVSSGKRAQLHLAAVFASNFSNHMYTLASRLMQKQHLPFSLLHPLIRETMLKALQLGPAEAQTGPARRGDRKILKKHLHLLAKEKQEKQLYKVLSKSIRKS